MAGDLTAIVPIPDGRGGERLAVGQSNYEVPSFDAALALPSVFAVALRGGSPASDGPLLGGDTASIGAMTAGDVNGDGWVDLFVGARVVGGGWPAPAPSRLLLGRPDGKYEPDQSNAAAVASLGLVTGAVFADVSGDGRPDLVAAAEFGPVRVLINEAGRLRDATRALGLDGVRSRWHGLAVTDADGDGRLDIVVTSMGRNLPWGASTDRPHVLYTGRFGAASLGLVFARADSGATREMPLESFARLGLVLPGLRDRVKTYHEFATRSVDELLGDAVSAAARVGATTYDHLLLLNRGERFEPRPLPPEAQRAPAHGVSAADFDGDGREDLFLSQNLFPTEIATMRLDAGVGLVLLGDGQGGYRALSVRESGVVIRGDQRGSAVADFDADGRVDLAVAQNGERTTLWRNVTGAAGLRVRVEAGAGNPRGIGAVLHMEGPGWSGPVRAVTAGTGHWSTDGRVTVLARPSGATTLVVRWGDGRESRVTLAAGDRELRVRAPKD